MALSFPRPQYYRLRGLSGALKRIRSEYLSTGLINHDRSAVLCNNAQASYRYREEPPQAQGQGPHARVEQEAVRYSALSPEQPNLRVCLYLVSTRGSPGADRRTVRKVRKGRGCKHGRLEVKLQAQCIGFATKQKHPSLIVVNTSSMHGFAGCVRCVHARARMHVPLRTRSQAGHAGGGLEGPQRPHHLSSGGRPVRRALHRFQGTCMSTHACAWRSDMQLGMPLAMQLDM